MWEIAGLYNLTSIKYTMVKTVSKYNVFEVIEKTHIGNQTGKLPT